MRLQQVPESRLLGTTEAAQAPRSPDVSPVNEHTAKKVANRAGQGGILLAVPDPLTILLTTLSGLVSRRQVAVTAYLVEETAVSRS